MRTFITKNINYTTHFKTNILKWAQNFSEIVYLESNSSENVNTNYEAIVAIDAFTSIKTDTFSAFETLQQYQQTTNDYLFGYLTYDLKNSIENLESNNFDGLQFPDIYFFQPKKLFFIYKNKVEIKYLNLCEDELETDFENILSFYNYTEINTQKPIINQRISKKDYLKKINHIKTHINKGNIYETNFCMEFYAENCKINPLETFEKLNQISKAPFSVFLKNNSHYLLCASPERYLKKENNILISQPIKGTAARFENQVEDLISKSELEKNPKEIAENVMIVDLVRNDLSKTAIKGSVKVTELCQTYTFKQVHQLISTIQSEIRSSVSISEILKTTFPMGSMTGAPKISAMQLMENFEETKRGLYSGSVGYITPDRNFDFNVVIRSILYNKKTEYLSFSVGSAITANAIAENEYNECLLKAKAMIAVLE